MTEFDYKSIRESCIKCGKCIPNCTIHLVNPDEVTSPRGFLELLGAYKSGNLELDKDVKSIFESCFLCTTCVTECPNSLPTDFMIEQVRNDIRKKFGLAWYKRAFFYLLRNRKVMDFLARLGYVEQKDRTTTYFVTPEGTKAGLIDLCKFDDGKNSKPHFTQEAFDKGLPYMIVESHLEANGAFIKGSNESIQKAHEALKYMDKFKVYLIKK